jgi:hypothetical protein
MAGVRLLRSFTIYITSSMLSWALVATFLVGVPTLCAQAAVDTSLVDAIGTYDVELTAVPGAPPTGRPAHLRMRLVISADSAALDYMRHHNEYLASVGSTTACWSVAEPGSTRYSTGSGHWHPGRADTIRIDFRGIDDWEVIKLAVGRRSVSGVEVYSGASYGGPIFTIRGHRVGAADPKRCAEAPSPTDPTET